MIINQVGGGTTPTGTKQITTNGTHNVADYEYADVQVPTTAPAHYVEKTIDANGNLKASSNFINLTGVTDLWGYALAASYATATFTDNTNIDMSSLTAISGAYACQDMFNNSSGAIHVDMSNVITISGQESCKNMFTNSQIASINLQNLTTISVGSLIYVSPIQNMFLNCSRLISLNLPKLTSVAYGMSQFVHNCQALTSVKMNALNVIPQPLSNSSYASVMGGCKALQSVEFGGLTASTFGSVVNQLQYLFDSYTGRDAPNGCTVHFPSNFDPSDPNHTFDASTLTGYPTFGGNASYIHVAFDLPATES